MARARPGSRAGAAVVTLVATLCGCSEGGYRVVVRFDPVELGAEVDGIEIAVVSDCEAQPRETGEIVGAVRRVEARRGDEVPALGRLDPGQLGLYARGWSSTCQAIAVGCSDIKVEAGGSGELAVTLTRAYGPPCPPGSRCVGGTCEPDQDADVDAPVDADPDQTDGDLDADLDADLDSHDADGPVDGDLDCACEIGGGCQGELEPRPLFACQACRPEISTDSWSVLEVGAPCRSLGLDGTCREGVLGMVCCTGCWAIAGLVCAPGDYDIACGAEGDACVVCEADQTCNPTLRVCVGG